jgi:phage/plasmid-associated DNA primase
MLAYEGYMERNHFFPIGKLAMPHDRRHVIITVLDDTVHDTEEKPQAKAWREFFDAIDDSDEEIPEVFERLDLSRSIEL